MVVATKRFHLVSAIFSFISICAYEGLNLLITHKIKGILSVIYIDAVNIVPKQLNPILPCFIPVVVWKEMV